MGVASTAYSSFPKDRFLEASDGARIAYVVVGDGPNVPVVYVNGWTCSDSYWAKAAPNVIAAGYPGVFFDLRGHGKSGLPRNPGVAARQLRVEDVSAQRLARDVVEVLDAAGIDTAVLVGHSIGVQIAVEVCRLAPTRVRGLVAVAGAFEDPIKTLAGLNWLYPVLEPLLPFLPLEVTRPVLRRIATPERGRWAAGLIGAVGPKTTPQEHGRAHAAHR
jgi:pimeloyl-ACP methyl ester carboxylesterase